MTTYQPPSKVIICQRGKEPCSGLGKPAHEAKDCPGRWLCSCGQHALVYETSDGRILVRAHAQQVSGY